MSKQVSNYIDNITKYFNRTKTTTIRGKKINLSQAILNTVEEVLTAKKSNKKVFFIGNGGSAAIANHKANDFWQTGKINTVDLSDSVKLTSISNDFGYENVFAKQIELKAEKNDFLFAISSSGESENIIKAVKTARELGCKIFTFSGFEKTNRLRCLGDLNFYTPLADYNQMEAIHLLLLDCILEIIVNDED